MPKTNGMDLALAIRAMDSDMPVWMAQIEAETVKIFPSSESLSALIVFLRLCARLCTRSSVRRKHAPAQFPIVHGGLSPVES